MVGGIDGRLFLPAKSMRKTIFPEGQATRRAGLRCSSWSKFLSDRSSPVYQKSGRCARCCGHPGPRCHRSSVLHPPREAASSCGALSGRRSASAQPPIKAPWARDTMQNPGICLSLHSILSRRQWQRKHCARILRPKHTYESHICPMQHRLRRLHLPRIKLNTLRKNSRASRSRRH